ncbi:MAG: hypothetical protein CSB15_00300 [Clostridiales bacterium]|nr:MAG: hypothetical protein CSB15_00300 [Clostridiales bacterium]
MNRYKTLIKYELESLVKNGWILGFALVLPCVLFLLISKSIKGEVPLNFQDSAVSGLFIGLSTIIPLAGVFLGHSANYSKEYESGVPQRLHLFGISNKVLITSKIISQLLFVIVAFIMYYVFAISVGLKFTNYNVLLVMLSLLIIQSLTEFLLAHSIVCLIKKFGACYAVTMILYFLFMIVSGNMGIRFKMLPEFLQFIGKNIIPFVSYNDFNISLLNDKTPDFKVLLLSNLIFLSFGIIVFIVSRFRDKRAF